MHFVEKIKLSADEDVLLVLDKFSDNRKFIYNWILAKTIAYYNFKKKHPSKKTILSFESTYRKRIKKGRIKNALGVYIPQSFLESLIETPSNIEDMVANDIYRAWKKIKELKDDYYYWLHHPKKAKMKPRKKPRDYPSFRKKRALHAGFTIHRKNNSSFKLNINDTTIDLKITKLPWLSLSKDKIRFLTDASQIKRISFKETAYGWYISILIDLPENTFNSSSIFKEKVGIDWGITKFATDSDGNSFKIRDFVNFKLYKKLETRRKQLQRKLCKKRKNNEAWRHSSRYRKLSKKIQVIYGRMANMRKNFIHHVSKYYASTYRTIVIEDLKPANMLKNHKLARAISEAMFYTWKVTLQYKAKFYGSEVILVDPKNTSQTCSNCGKRLKKKLGLSSRIFNCPHCSLKLDRDYNAAINIKNLATI